MSPGTPSTTTTSTSASAKARGSTVTKILKKIRLKKGPNGFGIAISEDRYGRLIVRGLNPNGVAYADGQMQVGDEIIAVDEVKVKTMKYDDVMHLLHTTQEPVEFAIVRTDRSTAAAAALAAATASPASATAAKESQVGRAGEFGSSSTQPSANVSGSCSPQIAAPSTASNQTTLAVS